LTDVADAFFAVDSASAFFLSFNALRGAASASGAPAEEADSLWAAARFGSRSGSFEPRFDPRCEPWFEPWFDPCPVAFFPLVVFAICLFRRAPAAPEKPDE
jgi:hypothetical protein